MTGVVLTGLGPVSVLGIGRAAWQQALARGAAPLASLPAGGATAEVRDFDQDALLPSVKTYLDRTSAFTLAAGQLALADAGMTPDRRDRWRMGVVLGSEFGCLQTLQTYTAALQQKGARLANPLLFSHSYVNTPTSLAAIEFGLGGHHGSFAGAGAGRQALESAIDALRLGRADLLLAIGVEAISAPLDRALRAEGALAHGVLGEGACAVVLERADTAAARGVPGIPVAGADADPAPVRALLGRTFAAETFFALAYACTHEAPRPIPSHHGHARR